MGTFYELRIIGRVFSFFRSSISSTPPQKLDEFSFYFFLTFLFPVKNVDNVFVAKPIKVTLLFVTYSLLVFA